MRVHRSSNTLSDLMRLHEFLAAEQAIGACSQIVTAATASSAAEVGPVRP